MTSELLHSWVAKVLRRNYTSGLTAAQSYSLFEGWVKSRGDVLVTFGRIYCGLLDASGYFKATRQIWTIGNYRI